MIEHLPCQVAKSPYVEVLAVLGRFLVADLCYLVGVGCTDGYMQMVW
jgi:hypothetical protein